MKASQAAAADPYGGLAGLEAPRERGVAVPSTSAIVSCELPRRGLQDVDTDIDRDIDIDIDIDTDIDEDVDVDADIDVDVDV